MYSTGLFVFSSTSITSLLYETCDAHLPCSCTPALSSEFPASEPQPPHTSWTAHAGATGTTSTNATQASHSPVPDSHPLQSGGQYHAARPVLSYADKVWRFAPASTTLQRRKQIRAKAPALREPRRTHPPASMSCDQRLSERPQAQRNSAERCRGTPVDTITDAHGRQLSAEAAR
jgi:hypothetical protein